MGLLKSLKMMLYGGRNGYLNYNHLSKLCAIHDELNNYHNRYGSIQKITMKILTKHSNTITPMLHNVIHRCNQSPSSYTIHYKLFTELFEVIGKAFYEEAVYLVTLYWRKVLLSSLVDLKESFGDSNVIDLTRLDLAHVYQISVSDDPIRSIISTIEKMLLLNLRAHLLDTPISNRNFMPLVKELSKHGNLKSYVQCLQYNPNNNFILRMSLFTWCDSLVHMIPYKMNYYISYVHSKSAIIFQQRQSKQHIFAIKQHQLLEINDKITFTSLVSLLGKKNFEHLVRGYFSSRKNSKGKASISTYTIDTNINNMTMNTMMPIITCSVPRSNKADPLEELNKINLLLPVITFTDTIENLIAEINYYYNGNLNARKINMYDVI